MRHTISYTGATPVGQGSGKTGSTSKRKEKRFMAKAKKGDVLRCEVCGVAVVVDEACDCAVAEILCCAKPMARGKKAAGRAKKPAAAKKPVKKTAKPPAKAAAKAKPAKAASKAKPAAKKPARAKK